MKYEKSLKCIEICDGSLNQIRTGAPEGGSGRSPVGPQGVLGESPGSQGAPRGLLGGPRALRRRHAEHPHTRTLLQGTRAHKGHQQCQPSLAGIEVTKVVAAPPGPQRPQAVHTGASRSLADHWGRQCVPRVSAGVPGDSQGLPRSTSGCFQGIPWGPPRAPRSGHIKHPNTCMVPRRHMRTRCIGSVN